MNDRGSDIKSLLIRHNLQKYNSLKFATSIQFISSLNWFSLYRLKFKVNGNAL
jgi:hypothetical protein